MVGLSRYRSNGKMGDVEDCLKVALCTQVSQPFHQRRRHLRQLLNSPG